MQTNENFIEIDLDLPNHNNQLSIASDTIEKLRDKFRVLETKKSIDDKEHELMFEEIIKVLDYVGRLSMPAFEVSDDIVTCYLTTFDGNYTLFLSKEEGLSELSYSKITE